MRHRTSQFISILLTFFASLCMLACHRDQPVTIRLAGDKWFLNSLVKTGYIRNFEQQTGSHVDLIYKNEPTIMNDLDRGAAGSSVYDIIVMRHRLLGTLVAKHQVQPIDSFLAESALHNSTFDPKQQLFGNWSSELSSYEGKTYGYPFTCLTTYLCYRKDLLTDKENKVAFQRRFHHELTVPTNWKEYNEVAQFFTQPKNDLYGTYIQGKRGLALWYEWLNLVYSFGGNILDAPNAWSYGDIVINSPQCVAATEEYLKLIAYSPHGTLNYGWDEAQTSLQRGKVFMGLLWSDQTPFLENPSASDVAGKIGYALVPLNSGHPFSQMEGLTYLIPTQAAHPREAYRFLEWAMSLEVQTEQTLAGSNSAQKPVYDDAKVRALPYTATFLAGIPIAIGKPTIPESDRMTDAMVLRVSEIVNSSRSPQNGLDQLALDLKQILGDKAQLRYPPRAIPSSSQN